MSEKNHTNKILTIVLAVIICISAIVLLYVNLPRDEKIENNTDNNSNSAINDNQTNDRIILLTVTYNNSKNEYTLEDLENFSKVTGTGRQVKSKLLPETILISPDLNESTWEFVGVAVSTILDEFENLPNNYNITVTSSDDVITEYTKDNVTGVVNIYNETGVFSKSGATMIIAYKRDNEYLFDDGPLRIVFVGSDVITESSLWAKYVVSIEVVEV